MSVITFSLPSVELHKMGTHEQVCIAGSGLVLGFIFPAYGGLDGYTWHNRLNGRRSTNACNTVHSALAELVMSTHELSA